MSKSKQKHQKELAAKLKARDEVAQKYISEFLGFEVSRRPYVILKAVVRLIDSLKAGERILPRSRKLRSDHYANVIRVQCTALLHLDLATNTVIAVNKKGELVPAGNSLFANKLDMPSRTVDEAISTLKQMGLYLSNERFKWVFENGERVFSGKNSIKRVCLGLFNLLDLGKQLERSIEHAKELMKKRQSSKPSTITREDPVAKMGNNYARVNQIKSLKRAEKRMKAKLSRGMESLKAVTSTKSNTAAQLDLLNAGASLEELRAAFGGSNTSKDNCDDIPY